MNIDMRFILLFFSNTCLAIFMAFFLYKLLKEKVNREDKKKWFFAGFYITILIGLITNTLMYFIRNETLIFYYMFVLLLYMTGIFLLDLFLLLKTSFSRIYIYIYPIIFAIMLFFQITIIGGVTINEGTNWSPYWSLDLYLYTLCSLTFHIIITIVSIKNIYLKVKDKKHQRIAFKQFVWGLMGVFSALYLSCAINYFHLVFLQLIDLILLLVSPYLMYIGVAKDYIEKKAFSEYFSFLKRKK
jgi:hypothetical protein